MTDLFTKMSVDRTALGQWAETAHGYYLFPKLEGEVGNRMIFRDKEVIVWSTNNYLGLANHPLVRRADAEAAIKYGTGFPMGARPLSAETTQHEILEASLAEFLGKEDSCILNFGYQGMVSLVDALLARQDIVVYDKECHSCIYDGIRLHVGKRISYEHNDPSSLEKALQRATRLAKQTNGGILVITEGVFGMQGEQGILREIVSLKDKYLFRLLVDDAHGFGHMGATGRGTGEEQDTMEKIDLYYGTFAKSMASLGGFVAGDKPIITYLRYNMRSQVFARHLPLMVIEGCQKRLEIIRSKEGDRLRNQLWHITRTLQQKLREAGLKLAKTNACVTPVYLSATTEEAAALVRELRELHGVFCSLVTYPATPKETVLLRLIPTAAHTDEDVDQTVKGLDIVARKLKEGEYRNLPVDSSIFIEGT